MPAAATAALDLRNEGAERTRPPATGELVGISGTCPSSNRRTGATNHSGLAANLKARKTADLKRFAQGALPVRRTAADRPSHRRHCHAAYRATHCRYIASVRVHPSGDPPPHAVCRCRRRLRWISGLGVCRKHCAHSRYRCAMCVRRHSGRHRRRIEGSSNRTEAVRPHPVAVRQTCAYRNEPRCACREARSPTRAVP